MNSIVDISLKKKKLVLIAYGWIGNRIRTISSANAFAKEYGRELKVIWIDYDQGMNMPFSRMFGKSNEFDVVEYKSKWMWFLFQVSTKLLKTSKLKKLFNCTILIEPETVTEAINCKSEMLIIKSHSRFYNFSQIPLEFSESVKLEGNAFLSLINGDFIGMHVRRGNNPKAIQNSPIELFIDVAREEIYKKNRKVLLCTDDAAVKKSFRDVFGDNVFTREVVLDHSSAAQSIDAAIDLYCLSKAQKIYGSYFSSFSTISAEFNHVPLIRLQVQ